jgi:hypothetical protein
MHVIKTHHACKVCEDARPMGRHIALLVCPKKARMARAYRDLPGGILLPPADPRLLRHAIAHHSLGDGVTHFPGIAPPRRHSGPGRLAILAACTAGLRPANCGDTPGTAMEGRNVRHASGHHARPFALRPALWPGIILGLDRLVLKSISLTADDSGISHRGLLPRVGSIPCLSEGALFTSAVTMHSEP